MGTVRGEMAAGLVASIIACGWGIIYPTISYMLIMSGNIHDIEGIMLLLAVIQLIVVGIEGILFMFAFYGLSQRYQQPLFAVVALLILISAAALPVIQLIMSPLAMQYLQLGRNLLSIVTLIIMLISLFSVRERGASHGATQFMMLGVIISIMSHGILLVRPQVSPDGYNPVIATFVLVSALVFYAAYLVYFYSEWAVTPRSVDETSRAWQTADDWDEL